MTGLNAHSQEPVVTDYLDYFGLNNDPFSSDPLPFYDGGSRRELFAELLHLCQFSASVLAVLGEVGVGKASLQAHLCDQFTDRDLLCEIDIPALSNGEWLLSSVAHLFAVDLDSEPGLSNDASDTHRVIAQIRQSVRESEQDDSLKVLIINHAQHLDTHSLQLLLRLAAPGEQSPYRQLHILLFATPEFEERLQHIDGQNLIQVFHLAPLGFNEMKHYLRYRLDAAGFAGIFPFKDSDVQFLYDISKGIPGKFHDAAREILIELALPPPENKSLGLPATHMAAIVLLLAGLLMVFFYRNGGEKIEAVPDLATTEPSAVTPANQTLIDTSRQDTSDATAPLAERDAETQPLSTSVEREQAPENKPNASGIAAPATTAEAAKKPPITTQSPSPKASADQEIDALLAAAKKELSQSDVVSPSTSPRTPSKPEPTPSTSLTADENALLNRAPDNFTLQILASGSRAAVDDFLKRQPNRDDLAVFTAKREGKTLYIVVMGSFPSSNAARLAVGQLPQEQQKAGPWPRSFESVQADIREFRGFTRR